MLLVCFIFLAGIAFAYVVFLKQKNKTPLSINAKYKYYHPSLEDLKAERNWDNAPNYLNRSRHSLLLFVGIYSAPRHLERRNAVRETWLSICKNTSYVLCRFVTDGQDVKGNALQGPVREKLERESRMHGDILLAQSPGGVNFARRYLWLAQWVSERYDFQYLLRVDDDYFICFEKLLIELTFHRPLRNLVWGWLHCSTKGKHVSFQSISDPRKRFFFKLLIILNYKRYL